MISLHGVTVVIPAVRRGDADRVLLHPLTLDLAEPRIALVGANGSGKSTLLRLLNGLRRPTVGTVTVDGLDTVKEARAVRARVGFVFTDPLAQLLMSTPIEDVELSLRGRIKGRAERNRRAQEMLDLVGLGHRAHASVHELSGGQQQRVGIARALAARPSVLLSDEATRTWLEKATAPLSR